jgi:hypothetical protein
MTLKWTSCPAAAIGDVAPKIATNSSARKLIRGMNSSLGRRRTRIVEGRRERRVIVQQMTMQLSCRRYGWKRR